MISYDSAVPAAYAESLPNHWQTFENIRALLLSHRQIALLLVSFRDVYHAEILNSRQTRLIYISLRESQ